MSHAMVHGLNEVRAAALVMIQAGDLLRTLAVAGRHPTTNDLYRAEWARAVFDGRPAPRPHGRRVQ